MKKLIGFEHGINLGGWLSQCDHTDQRYQTFIKEEDFKKIKDWGFDHVRIPVDYNLVEDEDGNYKEKGFQIIDQAFSWCKKNTLNMVLDLHKTFGYSFDEGEKEEGFFEKEEYQERFYRLWEEFAKRYGHSEEHLIFELLNEVTAKEYKDLWNEISKKCVARIRKIAPKVKILIGGYYNNSIEALVDLLPPYDENIIYNFHCYEPLIFTHQGAYWVPGMQKDFRISINETYQTFEEKTKDTIHQKTIGFEAFDPDQMLGAEYFEKHFKEAVALAESRNTTLYCGEYGVIDLAEPKDTLKWFQMINAAFDKYGICRAVWSYKEMDFGLIDKKLDEVRDKILEVI